MRDLLDQLQGLKKIWREFATISNQDNRVTEYSYERILSNVPGNNSPDSSLLDWVLFFKLAWIR